MSEGLTSLALRRHVASPGKVTELLAHWCEAFGEGGVRPSIRDALGKPGHRVWEISFDELTLNISLEMVTGSFGWLDQNNHGALGVSEDGRHLLLRQWYVPRDTPNAWLQPFEIESLHAPPPLHFPPPDRKDERGRPRTGPNRPFMLVADLSAEPAMIRRQTHRALDWHRKALDTFGNGA